MRISIALGAFLPPPPGPAGAVEMCWTGLAAKFAQLGHYVTVLHRDVDSTKTTFISQPRLRFLAVRGFRRSGVLAMDLVRGFIYDARLLRRIPPSDVVVANSFWLPVFLAPLRKSPKTCVTYNLARFPKGQLWLYRNVDCVLAVSNAVATALAEQCPVLQQSTEVVPNPIDTSVFAPDLPVSGGHGSSPVVLYTGRIHPEKGLDLLVRACSILAKEYPGLNLRLIGEIDVERGGGSRRYVEELRAVAAKEMIVTVLPAIYDRQTLASALRQCDVYCYPSVADRGESFGVAPLEAMGVGCPVVVSSLACFSDFVENGRNGLVFDHRGPSAAIELSNAIAALLRDRQMARRIGQEAAKTAKEFSYDGIANRYLGLFQRLVEARAQRES